MKSYFLLILLCVMTKSLFASQERVRENALIEKLKTEISQNFSVTQLDVHEQSLKDAESYELADLKSTCRSYQTIVNMALELHKNMALTTCLEELRASERAKAEEAKRKKSTQKKTGGIISHEEMNAWIAEATRAQVARSRQQEQLPIPISKPIEEDPIARRAREIYEYAGWGNRRLQLDTVIRTLRAVESHIGAEEAHTHVITENKRLSDLQDALKLLITQKEKEERAAATPTIQEYASSKE